MRFSGGHPASSQVFLRVRAAEALRFFSKNRVKLSFDTLLYNEPNVSPAFSKAADSQMRERLEQNPAEFVAEFGGFHWERFVRPFGFDFEGPGTPEIVREVGGRRLPDRIKRLFDHQSVELFLERETIR